MSNQAVLVVEDDADLRQAICHTLTGGEYSVLEAENGLEAIEIWQTYSPHLILMDMRMPVMDGYEATKRIKATTKKGRLPIVALTANALAGDREKCLAAGMDDYITKPVKPQQLAEMMDKWLKVSEADGETKGEPRIPKDEHEVDTSSPPIDL